MRRGPRADVATCRAGLAHCAAGAGPCSGPSRSARRRRARMSDESLPRFGNAKISRVHRAYKNHRACGLRPSQAQPASAPAQRNPTRHGLHRRLRRPRRRVLPGAQGLRCRALPAPLRGRPRYGIALAVCDRRRPGLGAQPCPPPLIHPPKTLATCSPVGSGLSRCCTHDLRAANFRVGSAPSISGTRVSLLHYTTQPSPLCSSRFRLEADVPA